MQKDKGLAIIIAIFLGGLGIHRFYIGKTKSALLFFFFCWTLIPSFIAVIDIIRYAFMSQKQWNEYVGG